MSKLAGKLDEGDRAPWKFGDIVAHPTMRDLHVMILKVGPTFQTGLTVRDSEKLVAAPWPIGSIQPGLEWWSIDDPSACGIKLDVSR